MKRRDFLKSVTGVAAGAMVPAPAIWSPAKADARSETLLLVTENGPNNLDIHGVGTNRPGYETSWNCYDRLISHETKTLPDGTLSYDRDKIKPELAEDMNAGDMSVTSWPLPLRCLAMTSRRGFPALSVGGCMFGKACVYLHSAGSAPANPRIQ